MGENVELLAGGRSPVGEAGADGEALLEDGAEVRREREIEGGLEGGEVGVGEGGVDGNVRGEEVIDDILGVGGVGEADSQGFRVGIGESHWVREEWVSHRNRNRH